MTVTFDASLLVSYYQARQGLSSASTGAAAQKSASKVPTAPWTAGTKAVQPSALAAAALAGGRFIDVNAAKLDVAGAPADYKDLFALDRGLTALGALALQLQAEDTPSFRRQQVQARFTAGLQEVTDFLARSPFQKIAVAKGVAGSTATTGVSVKEEDDLYTTAPLAYGSYDAQPDALQGDLRFSLTLTKSGGAATRVDFDLSRMTAPRTLSNVTTFLNGELEAAGVQTRFGVQRTEGEAQTVTAGGRTTTIAAAQDRFSLQLKGVPTEAASFSAPAAGPAVYVADAAGSDGASRRLLKLDPSAAAGTPDTVFGVKLPDGVTGVRQAVTAADGSVYVVADAAGPVAGQALKGASDVVLLRYDGAGRLAYARTLGASDQASGLALTVSPDGSQVAVAGSVTGALGDLQGAEDGASDGFVAVYDAAGVERWTDRLGFAGDDAPAAVAFGTDGSLYATGAAGGDGYLQAWSPTGARGATLHFGAAGNDTPTGLVVTGDGAVVTASVEAGHAVLRRFDAPPVAGAQAAAVRDLGALNGGGLLGVSLADDGSLRVAGTAAGGLALGTETAAYGGGLSVFAAALSADLAPSAADRGAWWSPGSDVTGAAAAVSGGRVYVAGTTAGPPSAGSTTPTRTGVFAAIDPLTGAVPWTRTIAGADGREQPTALAVDARGASALDRLGLPSGAVAYTGAADLVSLTSLRPGDGFSVAVNGGSARTVSIEAGETLDSLALKINRATDFRAAASVTRTGGFDQLQVAAANGTARITLTPGAAGADALKALGLAEGLVKTTADKATGTARPYALNLGGAFDLSTAAGAKAAAVRVSSAVGTVRQAYADLSAAAKPATPGKTGGTVPPALQARIANYQLALARLTGTA